MVADGGCTHVRVHVRDDEVEQAVAQPLTHVHPLAEVDLLRRVNPRADKAPFPLLLTCGSSLRLGACHHLRDEGVQHRGGRAIGGSIPFRQSELGADRGQEVEAGREVGVVALTRGARLLRELRQIGGVYLCVPAALVALSVALF